VVVDISSTGGPLFVYTFRHRPSWQSSYSGPASHGDDLDFTFNTASMLHPNLTMAEVELANAMSSAFVAFAKTGNPSTSTRSWPAYNASTREQIALDIGSNWGRFTPRSCPSVWGRNFARLYGNNQRQVAQSPGSCPLGGAGDYENCHPTLGPFACCTSGFSCLRHSSSSCSANVSTALNETHLCVPSTSSDNVSENDVARIVLSLLIGTLHGLELETDGI
jgi:hypothetical protein